MSAPTSPLTKIRFDDGGRGKEGGRGTGDGGWELRSPDIITYLDLIPSYPPILISLYLDFNAGKYSQVRVLLSFIMADLENLDKQSFAFGVLKAVLARKLLVPELYDIMDRVSEMMVRAHGAASRDLCRQGKIWGR